MSIILNPLDEQKYQDIIVTLVKKEFTKPLMLNTFFNNIRYLIDKSTSVEFKPEYEYSPQKVSLEYYNTKDLYQIIMLVNNCDTFFNFTLDNYKTLLIPSYDSITKLVTM